MVAAIGGGLCQLSNALYEAALQAGCDIVERHAHSRVVPGSAAALGRDATVAWNYIDLRFSPRQPLRISAKLTSDSLIVGLLGAQVEPADARPRSTPRVGTPTVLSASPRSCASCREFDCHIHAAETKEPPARAEGQAFLVDEAWPEFLQHVARTRRPDNLLVRPLDGAMLGATRHAWPAEGFAHRHAAPITALRRGLALRAVGDRGAATRAAQLAWAETMAAALARGLSPRITQATVAQSYLPFLWRDGHLGGRSTSVLMTRLPITLLQARLDAAFERHPKWPSLSDFRVPSWIAQAESQALAEASRIITPHAEIARLFGDRALRLSWSPPFASERRMDVIVRRRIAFAGPTAARKGALAVREAARALDLEVIPLGGELEGPDFWRDVRVIRSCDWRTAAALVQPAFVEHEPRRLLAALFIGMPVIATEACGLDPGPGLTLIAPGDVEALITALDQVLSDRATPEAAILRTA